MAITPPKNGDHEQFTVNNNGWEGPKQLRGSKPFRI